ncbi:MAG: sugar transferase [Pseudomonadota bacterium]
MSVFVTNLPSKTGAISASTPHKKSRVYRDVLKPCFDWLSIAMAGALAMPLIAALAALVATDGHSPFYSQKRIGKNGRIFRMWKLRTMVPNADKMLESYLAENPAAKAEWDATQKLKKDPRITPIGRLLRKSSMDELPQLFNVLRGDMSLVGPRPMMVDQRDLYPGLGYFRVRPGITGLWQVSDRNECDFQERAKFDDKYDRDISLKTDVIVLLKTFKVVCRGTGY